MNQFDIIKKAQTLLDLHIDGAETLSTSFQEPFPTIMEKLFTCKAKIILSGIGKSAHIARKAASTLSSIGKAAFFLHVGEAGHGDLGVIQQNDIVILLSNSGNTIELKEVLEYLTSKKITTIGISRNKESLLSKNVRYPIIINPSKEASTVGAPTTSTTQMLILLDIIASILQELTLFNKESYRRLHPAGSIGIKLKPISSVMQIGNKMPLKNEDTTMAECIIEMNKKRQGCTGIINSKNQLIGIITDGDLRRNIKNNIKTTQAKEIMTMNPITTTKQTTILDAVQLMNNNSITNIFITENSEPVGIVHIHDLIQMF